MNTQPIDVTALVADAERVLALAEKATPGPWVWRDTALWGRYGSGGPQCVIRELGWRTPDNDDDASLIALARTLLPAYVRAFQVQYERAERAEAQVRGLREALKQIEKKEGRYSRDPLTHAGNAVEDMASLEPVAKLGSRKEGNAVETKISNQEMLRAVFDLLGTLVAEVTGKLPIVVIRDENGDTLHVYPVMVSLVDDRMGRTEGVSPLRVDQAESGNRLG